MDKFTEKKTHTLKNNNEIGYFNDTVLIAKIDNQNKILIVNGEEEKGASWNSLGLRVAYDLQGKKYLLEWDLSSFNNFTQKVCFDYYYNDEKLGFACEEVEIMEALGINEGDKIDPIKLVRFENILNGKEEIDNIVLA